MKIDKFDFMAGVNKKTIFCSTAVLLALVLSPVYAADEEEGAGPAQEQEAIQQSEQEQQTQQELQTPEGGTVIVDQKEPKVTVEQAEPEVTVKQPEPEVTVKQPEPEVTVEQPEPQVDVQMPKPEVQVEQPKPEVTLEQPQPEVEVEQAKPEVQVEQAEPEVQVEQAEPEVQVEQAGEPEVKTEEGPLYDMEVQEVIGQSVVNEEDEEIGQIEDLVIDKQDQKLYAVVGVGGFLGIGQRQVVVPFDELQREEDQVKLATGGTQEELENKPEYDSANYESLRQN